MFEPEEATELVDREVSKLRNLGRDRLVAEFPSWRYVRRTEKAPSGNVYVVASRVGQDRSGPDSQLIVRVRVSEPGFRGRWKRAMETFWIY